MEYLTNNPAKSRGFSLVELMVSLTIGLIILSAVSMLFVSSKKTYTSQDNLTRLQENARFAMQFLVKDIRMAGYYGCLTEVGEDGLNIRNTLKPVDTFSLNTEIPLQGTEAGAADTITIRKGEASGSVDIATEMPTTSSELTVTSTEGFEENDIIMVSDCSGADIMQITQVQGTSSKLQHSPAGGNPAPGDADYPGNETQELSKKYKPGGTQIMKYTVTQYFIGDGASGAPALFRSINGNTAMELVEGVEQLQLLYGIDTDTVPGMNPDIYVTATNVSDWTRVRSVRVAMLVRTISDKETDIDSSVYDVDGDCPTGAPLTDTCYEFTSPGDRYKRRIFQTVVQVRNSQ